MTPDELAQRAEGLVRAHGAALAELDIVDGDVVDADLPRFDEINESYGYDALELLREYVNTHE